MVEPERTANVAIRNVFTNALLSNYRQHGEEEGAQKTETERKTIREKKKKGGRGEEKLSREGTLKRVKRRTKWAKRENACKLRKEKEYERRVKAKLETEKIRGKKQ